MLDLLLGAGPSIMERQEEEVEVSRLSEQLGAKFVMKIRALTWKEFDDLPNGDDRIFHMILKSVYDPDLSAEQLRKKFTPEGRKTTFTSVELVKTLFQPGEIVNLRNAITELSGFDDNAVSKIVKN